MKKFTAILLCFVLTVAMLTACRGKSPEETAGPTQTPSESATAAATEPMTLPTMPTILPTDPTNNTGNTGDATGDTGNTTGQQRQNSMPIQ